MSGHKKKPTKQEALTSWRWQMTERVSTQKEIVLARGTHELETADEGTCQHTERNRLSKGHSRPRDSRGTCQDAERN